MGYKGRDIADKQEKFSRLLDSLKIEYNEIDYKHPLVLEYPCVQKEVKLIPKQLDQKRWICLEPRAFKKVIMRLNTKNADVVRDYYLNLEEAMFAYGEYTMNYLVEKTERTRKIKDSELVEQLAIRDRSEEELQRQLEERSQMVEQLAIRDRSHEEETKELKQERSQMVEQLAIRDRSEEELKQRAEKAEKEAEEHRQYALVLKEIAINDQKRPLNEAIYISTSKAYANQNRFKVGGVESMDKLKPRFAGYNGRSSIDDEWFYSDIFKVANFRACEKRIEDVLGRFREKKSKEIYVMHYTNLRQHIKWITQHYEDEIEKFNEELDMLISNLNRHHLRPVTPNPYQGTSATITRIVDGIPTSTTIESTIEDQFKHKIKVYLDVLSPTTKELKRADLFEHVSNQHFNFNKIDAWRWLKELLPTYKPEINLKYR
jgi:hypothetical protein